MHSITAQTQYSRYHRPAPDPLAAHDAASHIDSMRTDSMHVNGEKLLMGSPDN